MRNKHFRMSNPDAGHPVLNVAGLSDAGRKAIRDGNAASPESEGSIFAGRGRMRPGEQCYKLLQNSLSLPTGTTSVVPPRDRTPAV